MKKCCLSFIFFLFLFLTNNACSASHHPQAFLNDISGKPDEGKQIVEHFCSNCHGLKPVIPLGAPRMGVKTDWEYRIKQGIDVLFKHTEEGYNAMPARGGCFECSDEQLLMAIESLLPKTKETHSKDHN